MHIFRPVSLSVYGGAGHAGHTVQHSAVFVLYVPARYATVLLYMNLDSNALLTKKTALC